MAFTSWKQFVLGKSLFCYRNPAGLLLQTCVKATLVTSFSVDCSRAQGQAFEAEPSLVCQ